MKKHVLKLSVIAILVATGLSQHSCTLLSGDELTPAFIYIDSFSLTSDLTTEGYPSERIQDAWIYVDGIQLGVFELPATVPVLDSGDHVISIFAGIKDNGISGTGAIYPFYTGFEYTATLIPYKTDTVYPTTSYYESLEFILLERFETGNAFSELLGSDTSLLITTDTLQVFEGNRSGIAVLENTALNLRIGNSPMLFPPVGQVLYLEMDYRNNMEFEVWLTGNYSGGVPIGSYVITLTPKDEWNKIYINLTSQIQSLQAQTYNLEFRALKPSSVTRGEIFFDNIKLVAF